MKGHLAIRKPGYRPAWHGCRRLRVCGGPDGFRSWPNAPALAPTLSAPALPRPGFVQIHSRGERIAQNHHQARRARRTLHTRQSQQLVHLGQRAAGRAGGLVLRRHGGDEPLWRQNHQPRPAKAAHQNLRAEKKLALQPHGRAAVRRRHAQGNLRQQHAHAHHSRRAAKTGRRGPDARAGLQRRRIRANRKIHRSRARF